MINDQDLPELSTFRRFERRLPFKVDESYARRVTATENENLPVHRWFRFKESFSGGLLKDVIQELTPSVGTRFRLLDPFCGVGTTLVASQELGAQGFDIDAVGIERNPFAAFVARTKVSWPSINSDQLLATAARLLAKPLPEKSPIPELTSITAGRCISKYMTRKILDVRDAIHTVEDQATRNALLLGLASAIEPVSKVRKDGRALRIIDKSRTALIPILRERWSQINDDVTLMKKSVPSATISNVIVGDGRLPSEFDIGPESFDLILTSPPYPNNIDYSEVYKLELWLLGFIKNSVEFLQLRKSTFRSHPTASLPAPGDDFERQMSKGKLNKLLCPLLERIQDPDTRGRAKLVIGYFSDLWLSLEEYYRCLRPGGYAIMVVGNSLHGRSGEAYLIPTDIGLGVIGECIGFSVERIVAARNLKRRLRGNHFLRESIVVLKKNE